MEALEADVIVRVYPPCRDKDPLLALPFHSQVLCARSPFFAARFSQRWQSTAQPLSTTTTSTKNGRQADAELFAIDIIVHHSSAASIYKRCIDLMYVRRKHMISSRPFSGVDDALHMLRIATELLFQDCMDACMEFLDMLCSWTPEEEASIRSTLSSLQLADIHADLARRLSLPQAMPMNEPTLIFRRMLVHVLQASTQSLKALDPSKVIPESSILVAWNTHLNIIRKVVTMKASPSYYNEPEASFKPADEAASTLLWLFDKLLALRAADAVVKVLAEDKALSSPLTVLFDKELSYHSVKMRFAERMLSLLTRMMQSVVKGEVLLSSAARLALTKTWLPVCDTKLISHKFEFATSLMSLVSSLPVVDRELFYKEYCMVPNFAEWGDSNFQGKKRIDSSFWPWCDMLREANTHLGGGSIALVSDDAC